MDSIKQLKSQFLTKTAEKARDPVLGNSSNTLSQKKSAYFDKRKPVIIIEGDKVEVLPSEQISPRVPRGDENSPNQQSSGSKKKRRSPAIAPKPFRDEDKASHLSPFQITLRSTDEVKAISP